MSLVLTTTESHPLHAQPVEMVERKGLGHPDSVCDALAEQVSVALSRFYLERFGVILHHNVDKVLLVGGQSQPAFGGGRVLEPIEIYLAGRATSEVKGAFVPVAELAIEHCRAWLRDHLRMLDVEHHVRLHCRIRPGSAELADLCARGGRAGQWLANDTSCGVGFAPLTPTEAALLEIERALRTPEALAAHPERGEDLKLMAVRQGNAVSLTIADAIVDRTIASTDDYLAACAALRADALALVADSALEVECAVNCGDDLERGAIYLSVTGSSAEAGDDGEAGRGNRGSGLITPYRPMSMEAIAGKNPVSHVGKLYNVAAMRIAQELVQRIEGLRSVECRLVSRIGASVREPQLVHLNAWLAPGLGTAEVERAAAPVVDEQLAALDHAYEDFLAGRAPIA